jgi:hypothetical protein
MTEFQIEDIINQFFRENNRTQLLLETRAVELWKEIVGSFIAQKSKAKKVCNGVLYVRVTEAALRFELSNSRTEIINRINAKLGTSVVKEIVFQ